MSKEWWFKFCPKDWKSDTQLSMCTSATRGVWIDLLCAMHESGCSGSLCGTPEHLARLARCSTAELAQALTDLQTTGAADVSERNGVVTLCNRRMQREYAKRLNARNRVLKHRCNASSNGAVTAPPYSYSNSGSDSSGDGGVGEGSGDGTPDLPEDLRELADCWRRWLDYRKEIRKPVKPRSAAQAFSDFRRWGVAASRTAIDASIRNGWQGLFEPKIGGNGSAVVDYAGERAANAEKRRNDQLARVNAMLQEEQ